MCFGGIFPLRPMVGRQRRTKMKMLILSSLMILNAAPALALPSPGRAPADSAPRIAHSTSVFTSDTRQELFNDGRAPWSAIGRLTMPGGGQCSATLVSPSLVLTAAHCVLDESGQVTMGAYRFDVGYRRGNYDASAGVINIWPGSRDPNDTNNDWAVLQLDTRLGDRFGFIGVRNLNSQQLVANPFALYLAAYASDYQNMEVPFWQTNCGFKKVVEGQTYVMHDCSTSSGASGGGMFIWDYTQNQFFIVGVNVAEYRNGQSSSPVGVEYSDAYANLAVPSAHFFPLLNQLYHQGL